MLGDYPRYILAWKLTATMTAKDVEEMLKLALATSALEGVRVRHRPRLLSDNGPCYTSGDLRRFLEGQRIERTCGAPYHPMTQGKIEHHHRVMKNLVQPRGFAYPWDVRREITCFMEYPGLRPGPATTTSATTSRWLP